jgi:hypothetical protein
MRSCQRYGTRLSDRTVEDQLRKPLVPFQGYYSCGCREAILQSTKLDVPGPIPVSRPFFYNQGTSGLRLTPKIPASFLPSKRALE